MRFFKQYQQHIVKYDLINKFSYNSTYKIPNLKVVVLTFKLKKWDPKYLISILSALKIITSQTPTITTSNVSNVLLKIRKGQPIGCKITLRNVKMNNFLFKYLNKIHPYLKLNNIKQTNCFSLKINNILIFNELEQTKQMLLHLQVYSCFFF